MSLFKKSSGDGLFKAAKTKTHKRHGAPMQAAGFPTSEDLRQDGIDEPDPAESDDPDTRFLNGERVELASTRCNWAQYEQSSQSLHVNMQDGTTIVYRHVPAAVAVGLIHADSPGRYIGQELRGYGYSVS